MKNERRTSISTIFLLEIFSWWNVFSSCVWWFVLVNCQIYLIVFVFSQFIKWKCFLLRMKSMCLLKKIFHLWVLLQSGDEESSQLVDCRWWIGQWPFVMCRLKVNGSVKELFIVQSVCRSMKSIDFCSIWEKNLALINKLANEMIWRCSSICQIDFVNWRDATFQRIWWEKQRQQLFNNLLHGFDQQLVSPIKDNVNTSIKLSTRQKWKRNWSHISSSLFLSFFRWKDFTWL